MTTPKRVTIINRNVFMLISACYFVVVALSIRKYWLGHDPYYPFQAILYFLLWGIWFYVFRRGRKSQQGDCEPTTKQ